MKVSIYFLVLMLFGEISAGFIKKIYHVKIRKPGNADYVINGGAPSSTSSTGGSSLYPTDYVLNGAAPNSASAIDKTWTVQTKTQLNQDRPNLHRVDTVYKEIRILDTVKVQESAKCKGTNAVN